MTWPEAFVAVGIAMAVALVLVVYSIAAGDKNGLRGKKS